MAWRFTPPRPCAEETRTPDCSDRTALKMLAITVSLSENTPVGDMSLGRSCSTVARMLMELATTDALSATSLVADWSPVRMLWG